MQLTAGEWRTRGGKIVTIDKVQTVPGSGRHDSGHTIKLAFGRYGEENLAWRSNGNFVESTNNHPLDLVEPCRAP